jgi:hypothetical protein
MDARAGGRQNPGMGRYRFTAYETDTRPRYVAVFGLQWQVIDCLRVEAGTDLRAAMAAAIERWHGEGWEAEGSAEYGFVFIRRNEERRLLMLTPRDPYSTAKQAFSPFQ